MGLGARDLIASLPMGHFLFLGGKKERRSVRIRRASKFRAKHYIYQD
jgi:hypothetical protein